eukprot:jgi/Mesvir1/5593/Mv15612-RA.1
MTKPDMYDPGVAHQLEPHPIKRMKTNYTIRKEVGDVQYPLEIRYQFLDRTLFLWVPIPTGYTSPLTEFLSKPTPGRLPIRDIAYVQMDVRNRDKEHTPREEGEEEKSKALKGNYLYLEWFYNRPQQFEEGTDEERISLRGFGRYLLCTGIRLVVDKGLFKKPENAVMGLEAGGGHCKRESKFRAEVNAMTLQELDEYLKKHEFTYNYVQSELKRMKKESEKVAFQRTTVCEIKDNLMLMNYYKDTYGMKCYDKRNGLGFLMEAPLQQVISACGKPYTDPKEFLEDLNVSRSRSGRSTRSASASIASAPSAESATRPAEATATSRKAEPDEPPPPAPAPAQTIEVATRVLRSSAAKLTEAVERLQATRPAPPPPAPAPAPVTDPAPAPERQSGRQRRAKAKSIIRVRTRGEAREFAEKSQREIRQIERDIRAARRLASA